MQKFIGTKVIQAKPMSRGEYNDYRGWELPSNENGEDEGFLVESLYGGQPNHPNHQGYVSWTTKEQFEQEYQPQLTMASKSEADLATEEMIKARGLEARRVSLDELHGSITDVEIIRHQLPSGSRLRFAILHMDNGFTVTGRPSVSISAENDNDEVGTKIAIQNAVHELWPLVGFRAVEARFNEGK